MIAYQKFLSSDTNDLLYAILVALSGNPITPTPPVFGISVQPQSQQHIIGESFNLSVTAVNGTQPYSYQWKKEGVAIDGATLQTLSFANAQSFSGGNFSVTVTDATGTPATSNVAAVTVVAAPVQTRVYYGADDDAPADEATIIASAKFIDVVHNADYNISFLFNSDPKICWWSELATETVKTFVFMTTPNSYTLTNDTPIILPTVIGARRLYRTANQTSFTEITQVRKTP